MSQEERSNQLQEQQQRLLNGPLKHVRAAALAAALLPLASIAATPASAQTVCGSGGVCTTGVVSGVVWNDMNNDGFHDSTEPGLENVTVTLTDVNDSTISVVITTNPDGSYTVGNLPNGTYTITATIPQGDEASPPNAGADDSLDSDGVPDGLGNSVATVILNDDNATADFGFHTKTVASPGTGTPGYWKNHPDAWPSAGVTIGGVTYTKTQAISWLNRVGKDKTTTMFADLVSAKLNVTIGNDSSCVASSIAAGDLWMQQYGPVGSNVAGGSYAWSVGDPIATQLDKYNNGLLCAPHRN